jgi:hypothetical protein
MPTYVGFVPPRSLSDGQKDQIAASIARTMRRARPRLTIPRARSDIGSTKAWGRE